MSESTNILRAHLLLLVPQDNWDTYYILGFHIQIYNKLGHPEYIYSHNILLKFKMAISRIEILHHVKRFISSQVILYCGFCIWIVFNTILALLCRKPIFYFFISNMYNGLLYCHISLDPYYKYWSSIICNFTENETSIRKNILYTT